MCTTRKGKANIVKKEKYFNILGIIVIVMMLVCDLLIEHENIPWHLLPVGRVHGMMILDTL
jgi:hypothetical protein